MGKDQRLPFVIGQKAEAMSFQEGYRGAWFRCEIKKISRRKGEIGTVLDYFDFPDEKPTWMLLYQVPPIYGGKSKERRRQLMLRPQYPAIYHESQSPDVDAVPEVIVIVDGVWKVGDLVDWWTTGCYWSGRLTEILDNDKARIELTPPPMGEGLSYEISLKDLRPSLEWSLELGWTVPISKDGKESRRCARLIQPVKQAAGNLPSLHIQAVVQGTKDMAVTAVTSFDSFGALGKRECSKSGSEMLNQPLSATHPKELKEASEITTQFVVRNNATGETSSSDRSSASHIGDTSAEITGQTAEEDLNRYSCSLKKFKSSGGIPLNSKHSDTLEAAILDLEELANKVKWLKRVLESGTPVSNAVRPPWEFVEHRGSSMPR